VYLLGDIKQRNTQDRSSENITSEHNTSDFLFKIAVTIKFTYIHKICHYVSSKMLKISVSFIM